MILRNNTTLLEVMTTYLQDIPQCGRKGNKQCQSSPKSSIPCAPSWVSKTLSDIRCSSITVSYIDKVVEEYKYIFPSATGVPLHCQVKQSIDLTPSTPLPNRPVYHHSPSKNEEVKHQIQELLKKGHIHPSSSPCGCPIMLVQKK
jgi:hypothetical protein